MKKYLCVMLAVILCFSVMAGCGQKTAGTDKPADSTAAGSDDTAPSGDSDGVPATSNEPITFTMFLKLPNTNYENWESPVAKKITELTGVTIKQEWPVGELSQKVGLMIAGNEYPDLIYVGGQEQNQLIAAGAYIQLDEYIEKYGRT